MILVFNKLQNIRTQYTEHFNIIWKLWDLSNLKAHLVCICIRKRALRFAALCKVAERDAQGNRTYLLKCLWNVPLCPPINPPPPSPLPTQKPMREIIALQSSLYTFMALMRRLPPVGQSICFTVIALKAIKRTNSPVHPPGAHCCCWCCTLPSLIQRHLLLLYLALSPFSSSPPPFIVLNKSA